MKESLLQDLSDVHLRPGFLLRRAHQIASAQFVEETSNFGVTTTQFGVLTVLALRQPIDQIGVAKILKLDRSTTGLVVQNLEERGLVARLLDPEDRRRRVLHLTTRGRDMLADLQGPSRKARDRVLSTFTPEEAQMLITLLSRFVTNHDEYLARAATSKKDP